MNAYVHRICLYIKITCFMYIFLYIGGFPGGSVVKNLLANAGDAGDTGFRFLGQEDFPWRRKWQPIPIFLPGKCYGQRSLAGYTVHGITRVRHD